MPWTSWGARSNNPTCSPCQIDISTCGVFNTEHGLAPEAADCVFPWEGWEYRMEDYLKQMWGQIKPIINTFGNKYNSILNLFFNKREVFNQYNQSGTIDVLKYLPNVKLELPLDGQKYIWWEKKYVRQIFKITQDYTTATNEIQVGISDGTTIVPSLGWDYTVWGRGRLIPQDTIRIRRNDPTVADDVCCEDLLTKTIIAVNPATNTITLEQSPSNPSGFTFKEGDSVEFLFHAKNECDIIDNTPWLQNAKAYSSYIQHFTFRMEFTQTEANTSYAMDGWPAAYFKNRLNEGMMYLVDQMGNAIYEARNRAQTDSSRPAETMGLFPQMDKAEAELGISLTVDASQATTDEQKVALILDQILAIQASGFAKEGKKIILVCNTMALNSLIRMNAAWNRYVWVTVNSNDNTVKDFGLPIIRTPFGTIEYRQCDFLTERHPNEGAILFLPEDSYMVKGTPNTMVDLTANGAQIVGRTAGLRFENATAPDQHRCKTFDVFTEMAFIWVGIRQGSVRFMKGLKSC